MFDFPKKEITKVRKCFGVFGVFVKQIVVFNIGFGFCVFNSIWEHRLKIFFDPKSRTNRPPKNRKFGGYFWDFWSPYVAEASLGRAF